MMREEPIAESTALTAARADAVQLRSCRKERGGAAVMRRRRVQGRHVSSASGVHLVCIWFAFNSHLVNIWFAFGLFAVGLRK